MTSNNDYDVISNMTFCNCNVTVTELICMFITRVKYDIYFMTISHEQWPVLHLYITFVKNNGNHNGIYLNSK